MPSTEAIVVTLMRRDRFRERRLHFAVRCAAALAACLLVSLAGTVAMALRGDAYRYVMVESGGKLLPLVPLDRPNQDDEFVEKWTSDALSRIYTFDFANYRTHFQEARNTYLTEAGWLNLEESMRDSGNLDSIIQNRYVTTAVPTAPARVVQKGLMPVPSGERRWAWVVQVPLHVTYRSSVRTTTQSVQLLVVCFRTPEYLLKSGIGIRSIVPT